MRARTLPLALLAVLALGVGAWALGLFGESGPGPAPAGDDAADAAGADARLAATATKEKPAAGDAPAPRPRGGIFGVVRRAGQGAAARVEVYLAGTSALVDPPSFGSTAVSRLRAYAADVAPKPTAAADTGADGAFAFEALAAGTYDVVAIGAAGGWAQTRTRLPAEGARLKVLLSLTVGGETLRGRVLRADGRPWHGLVAAAGAVEAVRRPTPALSTRTDEEGRFVLEGLPPQSVQVTAAEPGTRTWTSRLLTLPRADEWTWSLPPDVEVRGTVVAASDGKPIAGATVVGSSRSRGDTESAASGATTDDAGAFRLLAPAITTVEATAVGYRNGYLTLRDAAETPVIRLVRPSRLSGRVVADGDGTPVPGIGVVANPVAGGERLATTSSADGTYAFEDLPAGEVSLLAAGGGWVSKGVLEAKEGGYSPLVVELPAEGKATFDVVVARGGRAEGKVLDTAGAPAPGAVVTPEFAGNQRSLGWTLAPMLVGAAGPDGGYAMDGIPAGAVFSLGATRPDSVSARAGPFRADPAAPVRADLRFAAGTMLDLLVVDKGTKAPVAGVRVTGWYWTETGAGGNVPQVATGSDGRAKVGPVSGMNGNVSVDLGGRSAMSPFSSAVGGLLTIELPPPAARLEVSGRVEFADGGSLEGLEVYVQLVAGERSDMQSVREDGTFRFQGVPAGTVKLTAQLGWDAEAPSVRTETTAGSEDVRLRFEVPRPLVIEVRVLSDAGDPVPSFQGSSIGVQSQGQRPLSGRDGRATLYGVRKEAWVLVWKAQSAAGEPLPLGATAAGPFPAGRSPVEIRMGPERVVEGVVRSKDGTGLRGVLLTARPLWLPAPLMSLSNTAHGQARTDERGAFRIGGLGAGEYALAVAPPSEYPTPPPVSVAAGQTHVEVTVGRGAAVQVTVQASDGRPLLGASVTARSPGQRQRLAPSAGTDESGVARIEGLDPATRYELVVEPPRGAKAGLSKKVPDWAPRNETVRLDPAFSIRGTFRRPDGKPLAGAFLYARPVPGGADEQSYAQTQADGGFSFDALRQATYRLNAATSAPRFEAPETLVEAGGPDVVLVGVECSAKVSITFEGWPKDQGQAWFQLRRDGANQGSELSGSATDGKAVVEGLRPDATYTLYGALSNGLLAYAKGIHAGEAVVPIRQGKSIQGHLKLPALRNSTNVWVEDVWAGGKVEPDGAYTIQGLPDGTWTVHVQVMVDQGWWSAEGRVDAGGTLDLEPKPK